jgi:hypothetical protein
VLYNLAGNVLLNVRRAGVDAGGEDDACLYSR